MEKVQIVNNSKCDPPPYESYKIGQYWFQDKVLSENSAQQEQNTYYFLIFLLL